MTLVEVLVVMLLIALMTALAAGTARSGRPASMEIDRLVLVLESAAERARVRGTPLRFETLPHGYRFSRLDTAGNWQTVTDDALFVEHGLPTDIALGRIKRDGQEVQEGLVFGSDVVLFSLEGVSPAGKFTLEGQASGALKKITPAESSS
jgi:type II secretion system protein H